MYGHDTQENKYYTYDSMLLQNLPNTLTKVSGSNAPRFQAAAHTVAAPVSGKKQPRQAAAVVTGYEAADAAATSR